MRTKTVFETSQVAHIWANQLQSTGRNAHNNFYFDAETIYSYGRHFPIARIVKNSERVEGVLFTEQRYSNTTAKHIALVAHACSHTNIIYCYNPTGSANSNFLHWISDVETISKNLLKAKKPEIYLSQIDAIKGKAEKYAAFMGVAIPDTLQIALSITDKESYQQYTDNKTRLVEKELKKRHKKDLSKWLAGETHHLYIRDGFDYLRVRGEKVQTSQGIEMTLPEATDIYNRLKNDKLKAGDTILNGYAVIKVNGEVKIGCHNFKKSYLLSFGKKLQTS